MKAPLTPQELRQHLKCATDPRDPGAAELVRAYVSRKWPLTMEDLSKELLDEVNRELSVKLTPLEGLCLLGGYTFPEGVTTDIRPDFVKAVTTYWWSGEGVRALILSRVVRSIDSMPPAKHVDNIVDGMMWSMTDFEEWEDCDFKLDAELGDESIYCNKKNVRVHITDDTWLKADPHFFAGRTLRTMGVLVRAFHTLQGDV